MVNVTGFDPSQAPRTARIVDCVVKYTCPGTGDNYLLQINQALHIPEMEHCLLCPMQCRVNGVLINEVPKYLSPDPTDSTHSITIPQQDDAAQPLIIPLRLEGVVSYFDFSLPDAADLEDVSIPHLELTAEGPEWDPYDPNFANCEDGMLDFRGRTIAASSTATLPNAAMKVEQEQVPTWNLSQVSLQYDTADIMEEPNFVQALEQTVNISLVKVRDMPTTTYEVKQVRSDRRRGEVGFVALANRWGIPLNKAKDTIRCTTQRGVRTTLHPTLSRRYSTNDRMLRYHRIPCTMFTDTMFSKYKSSRGNTCAQVFATDFGWSRTYPMRSKGDAHEALSLLFQREGVPIKMVSDGSMEQKHGRFHKKCKEAQAGYSTTEPYSQWMNS